MLVPCGCALGCPCRRCRCVRALQAMRLQHRPGPPTVRLAPHSMAAVEDRHPVLLQPRIIPQEASITYLQLANEAVFTDEAVFTPVAPLVLPRSAALLGLVHGSVFGSTPHPSLCLLSPSKLRFRGTPCQCRLWPLVQSARAGGAVVGCCRKTTRCGVDTVRSCVQFWGAQRWSSTRTCTPACSRTW